MKKNLVIILLIGISVFGLFGCKKYKKGCVEIKSNEIYYCRPDGDLEGPFGVLQNDFWSDFVEYDNKSCASLGYTKEHDGIYNNKDGNSVPGKKGYWGSGQINTNEICEDPYFSPWTDPQINPFCELAYNTQCILGLPVTDVQVTTNCQTWDDWQTLDSRIPNCPYCQEGKPGND